MKKRGMSAVVTTLIIILLVIVSLGIVWIVVRNILERGTEQVELAQKCREVDLEVRKLQENGDGENYTITLSRTGTGDDIAGVKITLFNSNNDNSNLLDFNETIGALGSKTMTLDLNITGKNLTSANKIDMTAYFDNDQGGEDLCPTSITHEF